MARLNRALAGILATADISYPTEVLDGAESGLLLFAAGFFGKQDGVFFAEAGIPCVAVDYRRHDLSQMAAMYPSDWVFVEGDVYGLLDSGDLPAADVVSIDCPSGHFQICAELIDAWCDLARRAVVLGVGKTTEIFPPRGWRNVEKRRRSSYAGGTYWAIVTPAEETL